MSSYLSQSTENIRRDLERSWPKDILASRVSMTPMLALETSAKRVLDETKRIGKEEKEEEVYEDISADAKEVGTRLDEMRKERDVCVCFHRNRNRSVSRDDEDEEKKKEKEEKFLRSCFPRQGVEVVEDEREASLDARVRIFDRFSYEKEKEEEKWMTDAIECIERSRKSNVFIVVENCETEEKARELRSEVYSGAMAFSKKRSEEDEFCFCLEGGLVFEDDGEERAAAAAAAATTTTTTSFETENKNRSRGLFALGSDDSSDSSEDDIDEEKIAKEIGILSISDNNTDRKTCRRAQTNISNAIREICFERAEKYALRFQPIRERIYAKLKEKAKAKKKREKEKNAQHQTFSVSNDEPVRMSTNASSPLVKNKQIVEETNELASVKKEDGVLSFLDWMGSEEDGNVSPSEQKGISYQSKADAARIKALEAALRELQPDHPLLMFCPVLPPKT